MSEPESTATASAPTADDRNIAMLAHLLGIFTYFIGSLIIWLVHKDKPEKAFVSAQAKEALNFQITMLLAYFVSGLLVFVLIGFLLIFIVFIVDIVFCIVAAISVSSGNNYRYPIVIRLLQ
ncbi:MAG: DUF4870 domain-containing protein [Betaproteobacteria bacterium]|nr:DUF4870 domain-containing protein [Betaproteobacteria bacterium]